MIGENNSTSIGMPENKVSPSEMDTPDEAIKKKTPFLFLHDLRAEAEIGRGKS
jgi:hypothetical protein